MILKTFRKPRGFEDFTVAEAAIIDRPHVLCVYDLEHKIIWLNTAAAPDANVILLEPRR